MGHRKDCQNRHDHSLETLEEHFLVVPLVFRFNHFWGENSISEYFSTSIKVSWPNLVSLDGNVVATATAGNFKKPPNEIMLFNQQ
jgi:hypothetical protein